MVWPCQKDARGENTRINYGMDTTGEKEKRMSKKNVDGRSTSSPDNKKFRTRSMEKERGMAFGFQKTVTAVIKPDRCIQYACLRNKLILTKTYSTNAVKDKEKEIPTNKMLYNSSHEVAVCLKT